MRGVTTSKLKISGNNTNIVLEYVLDTTVADYRLLQHGKVQQLSRVVPESVTVSELAVICDGLFSMIDAMFQDPNITKQYGAAVFFHQAALRTRLRSLQQQNPDYACVPYPAYLLGRSYFFCQEDVVVKKDLVLSIFRDHPDLLSVPRNQQIHAMINSSQKEQFGFDEIYAFSMERSVFLETLQLMRNKQQNERIPNEGRSQGGGCAWWCPIGCGSDWGCCGNYSGCCLYASLECYIHDRICSNCEPRWFCFNGCVPDKK
jgi:hypothetical protein